MGRKTGTALETSLERGTLTSSVFCPEDKIEISLV